VLTTTTSVSFPDGDIAVQRGGAARPEPEQQYRLRQLSPSGGSIRIIQYSQPDDSQPFVFALTGPGPTQGATLDGDGASTFAIKK